MGINLRDHVHDVDDLFTLEEAEQLFIAAGYKKKQTSVEGFEKLEITSEMLCSNQQMSGNHLKFNFKQGQQFGIQVQQKAAEHPNLQDISVKGFEKVIKYTSTSMGGAA
ncbi:hypothetical protein [Metalysinibacillus jejuensis]|uniref:hypothetical protein n=1 Tax=Metalysinibacillus jejuensis TaxID=914327 RepID=UPI000D33B578|nr:hypothetical protein [Metalysinibacillus jejuensis]